MNRVMTDTSDGDKLFFGAYRCRAFFVTKALSFVPILATPVNIERAPTPS